MLKAKFHYAIWFKASVMEFGFKCCRNLGSQSTAV